MPAPRPPFKTVLELVLWNGFKAAVVLFLMSSVSSKCLPFDISYIFGNRKKSLGLGPMNREGVLAQLFVY
jgi:hypothetical protein